MNQITHHLKKSKNVLVVSHTNPDGDAIGSLIAMGLALAAMNKKTTLYNESPIPAVYRFLPGVDRVVQHLGNESYDTAVILDCGDWQRVGGAVSTVKRTPVIINIDHHVTNTSFGNYKLIDTSACATAEIVYHLIKKLSLYLDARIAASRWVSILTKLLSVFMAPTLWAE